MKHEGLLAEIKQELERLDPEMEGEENDVSYRIGVLLLTAVWVAGANVEALIELTGYPSDFVSTVSSRLRRSGL